MDFIVRFIGIILFVANTSSGGYDVVMPEDGKVCGEDHLPDHQVFVRVPNGSLQGLGDVMWPGSIPCLASENCTLYPVDDAEVKFLNVATTGAVNDAGFVNNIPHLKDLAPANTNLRGLLSYPVMTNAETRVRTGKLEGDKFPNKMYYTKWKLQTTASDPIIVVAQSRSNAANVKRLVLKPGTEVTVLNSTLRLAQLKIGDTGMGNDHRHFVLFYRMVTPTPSEAECASPTFQSPMDTKAMDRGHVMITGFAGGQGGVSVECSNSQWP